MRRTVFSRASPAGSARRANSRRTQHAADPGHQSQPRSVKWLREWKHPQPEQNAMYGRDCRACEERFISWPCGVDSSVWFGAGRVQFGGTVPRVPHGSAVHGVAGLSRGWTHTS